MLNLTSFVVLMPYSVTNLKEEHEQRPEISSDMIDVRFPFATTPTTTMATGTGGCGVTIGCFNDSLGNAVLYSPADDGLSVDFEIICRRTGSGWCAVGFSYNTNMVNEILLIAIFLFEVSSSQSSYFKSFSELQMRSDRVGPTIWCPLRTLFSWIVDSRKFAPHVTDNFADKQFEYFSVTKLRNEQRKIVRISKSTFYGTPCFTTYDIQVLRVSEIF